MAEGFKKYKRTEWWRESGEVSDKERRMSEASAKKEAYTLKAGSDGKNTPPVTAKYAKKSGKKKVETKLVAKKYVEEFGEEDDDLYGDQDEAMADDLDMSSDEDAEGINSEDDIPMDAEDDMESPTESICTCPACGAKLVIETVPDEEAEGEDEFEDEGGDEGMGMDDGMDVESEEDDMTVPKLESKYKNYSKKVEAKKKTPSKNTEESFEEAYAKWKKERTARLEAIKAKSTKRKAEAKSEIGVEYGSETGDMVGEGESASGGKTKVGKGNDKDFGIVASDTNMVGGGKTSSGSKSSVSASGSSKTAESRKAPKKAMAEEEAATTDPFEDEDDLAGMLDGDDFANIPTDVGADSDQIEHYEAVQKRRKNRDLNESVAPKSSFDFKKLVRGEYK